MTERDKNTSSLAFSFSDSLLKGIMGFCGFLVSIAYLIFYLLLDKREAFHDKLAIVAVLVFVACMVWAVGREAFLTAIHSLKELFRLSKKDESE